MIQAQILYDSPLCVIRLPDICQLNCKYCFRQNNKSIEKIQYTAKELAIMLQNYPEIKRISFLGGEPLLFETFIKDVIKETNSQIDKYIITTNGLWLNKDNINFFVKHHCQINISLDGSEEVNDINRGKGTYRKILTNIRLLQEQAPFWYFWTISSTFSQNTISKMFNSYLHIREITPPGWALNLDKHANWTSQDLEIISNEIKKIFIHYNTNPRTIKWFLNRIYESGLIYVHTNHLIVKPSGVLVQGEVFSKEALSNTELKGSSLILGNIFTPQNLKPLIQLNYDNIRPCFSDNCGSCELQYKNFYQNIAIPHGKALCKIYSILLNGGQYVEQY